ncbi:MAG: NAD(P)H-binding protein [Deltaproteobacteria bacterium]|nr:NAD(P)H-binding protein [Deltaproteobacteria bacterium]
MDGAVGLDHVHVPAPVAQGLGQHVAGLGGSGEQHPAAAGRRVGEDLEQALGHESLGDEVGFDVARPQGVSETQAEQQFQSYDTNNTGSLTDAQLADYVLGCDAVVSCLGHVISFRGIFGAPRKLCTEAVQRLCLAIEANKPVSPVRFILMNTVGVANPEQGERRTWPEKGVLTLLRWCIPPHVDNELAANHLENEVGSSNDYVQWCSVRPDSLIDENVSTYDVVASPVTGIFSGRPTTRANVAHFMLELVDSDDLWDTWKYKMPVIMNSLGS